MYKVYRMVFLGVFLPAVALAGAPAKYTLLAPMGSSLSGQVDLKGYLTGLFEVTIGVAGILAVVMIVICGIQMMGSPSVSQKSASKECITNAIFGLLLAVGSWIILNSINSQLLLNDLHLADTALVPIFSSSGPSVDQTPTTPGFYFRYKDSAGNTHFTGPLTQQMCTEVQLKQFASNSSFSEVSDCFEVKLNNPPSIVAAKPRGSTAGAGGQGCGEEKNLCEPRLRDGQSCSAPGCPRFSSYAKNNAGGAATASLTCGIH